MEFNRISTEYFESTEISEFNINTIKGYNDKASYFIKRLLQLKQDNGSIDKMFLIQCINNLFELDINLALGFLLELSDRNILGEYIFFTVVSESIFGQINNLNILLSMN